MNITGNTHSLLQRFILFLTSLFLWSSAHADSIDITKQNFFVNMVKINAKLKTGKLQNGFGLIMYENNGYLFIATPRHVIEDNQDSNNANAEELIVTTYQSKSYYGEVLRKHRSYDLALIRCKAPPGFTWNHAKYSGEIEKGLSVAVLGYDWRWGRQPELANTYITDITDAEVYAKTNVKIGSSGGLLVTGDMIVGMITDNDNEAKKVYALRLDFVSTIVHNQWLQNEINTAYDWDPFPYFNLGAYGQLLLFLTSVDENQAPLAYGSGFYFDYLSSPSFGIRLSHFEGKIKSKISSIYFNESLEFQNNFTLNTIYFMFGSGVKQTPYTVKTQGVFYIYLGYGMGEHNPELNVNGQGWQRLDSFSQFQDNYSNTFQALSLGLTAEKPYSGNLSFGLDIGFTFTDEKYLAIDVNNPFENNSLTDTYLYINLNVSYAFGRPPAPPVKMLY